MKLSEWKNKFEQEYEMLDPKKMEGCGLLFNPEKGFVYYKPMGHMMFVVYMCTTDHKYFIDVVYDKAKELGLVGGFTYTKHNPHAYARLLGGRIRFDLSGIENGEWYIEFPAPNNKIAYVLRSGKYNPDIHDFFKKYKIEQVEYWDEWNPPPCVTKTPQELDKRFDWWTSPCGHGSYRIDLNLAGDILECPYKPVKIGTIYDYEHIAYERPYIECTNCKLFACCKARCDIEKNTRRLQTLCEQTKKEYIPILEGGIK